LKPRLAILPIAVLISWTAFAQTIPATGLCNTGLTAASPLPLGCTTSTPVTPANPISGGPSMDGNWQLATPYPSAAYDRQSPNPCTLRTFGPAWVDTPLSGWFNPNDGLSQWISPESDGPNTTGGWYIYRTAIPVPSGSGNYVLTILGKLLSDDFVPAIYFENEAGNLLTCRAAVIPSLVPVPTGSVSTWNPFQFSATVAPGTTAYLYVVVFNVQFPAGESGNYTALRVEFDSADFTPVP